MPEKKKVQSVIRVSMLKKGVSIDECIKDVDKLNKEQLSESMIRYKLTVNNVFNDIHPFLPEEWDVNKANKHEYKVAIFIKKNIEGIERMLLFTFGDCRSFILGHKLEPFFGKRILLNVIDVQDMKIKSAKSKNIISSDIHLTQKSKSAKAFNEYDVNTNEEVINELKSEGVFDGIEQTLVGGTSFTFKTTRTFDELEHIIDILVEKYISKNCDDNFGNLINNFSLIKDKDEINELDKSMIEKLKSPVNLKQVIFHWPDILSNSEMSFFVDKRNFKEQKFNNVDSKMFDYVVENFDIDDALLKLYISSQGGDGSVLSRKTLKECVSFEMQHNDEDYVISDGSWHKVSKNFKTTIESKYKLLADETYIGTSLPVWDLNKNEGIYNQETCDANVNLINLDKEFVYFGGNDKIEICDILVPSENALFAVKDGSVATGVSHLRTQIETAANSIGVDHPLITNKLKKITMTTNGVPYDFANTKCFVVAIGTERHIDITNNAGVSVKLPKIPFLAKSTLVELFDKFKSSKYRLYIQYIERR